MYSFAHLQVQHYKYIVQIHKKYKRCHPSEPVLWRLHCLRYSACACQHWWGVGGSALAGELVAMLGRWRLHVGIGTMLRHWRLCVSRAFAGWRGSGHISGVVMLGHQWWHVGRAMALSQFLHWHAGVRGGGTQKST